MADKDDGMARVLLIAMKGSLDRLDMLLSESNPIKYNLPGGQRGVNVVDVKAIRDDLWSAWFEIKDRVR